MAASNAPDWLDAKGWSFVIRMKKDVWCQLAKGRHFQIQQIPLGLASDQLRGRRRLAIRLGSDDAANHDLRQINFEDAVAGGGFAATSLSLHCGWSRIDPKDEPWYLLSKLPVGKALLERYARRFWIEERFRDFKEQGFRREKTQLESGKRVEIVKMCVCIAYTWTLFLGLELAHAGKRREIDRPHKPQLSLFAFALRYLKRLFARREEFPRQFRLSSPKYEG